MIKTYLTTICLCLLPCLGLCGTIGLYTNLETNDIHWTSRDFGNELVTVANEIASVVNWSPGLRALNQVGWRANSSLNTVVTNWTIREMQDMIIARYDDLYFGTNTLEGQTNLYALSALGGQGANENFFPIEDFYQAAGLTTNGFRRVPCTNAWPSAWTNMNDPAYLYGTIQAGDIVGPWNVDDIQRCFDVMTQRVSEASWRNVGYPTETNRYIESNNTYTNYADAVAALTADWGSDSLVSLSLEPRAYAYASYSVTLGQYQLTAYRIFSTAAIQAEGVGVDRTITYYSRVGDVSVSSTTRTNIFTFDSNGDDVQYQTWHAWSVTNAAPTSAAQWVYSDYLGDQSLPLPTLPTQPATNEFLKVGYEMDAGYKLSLGADDKPIAIETFEWSYTRE